MVTLQTRLDAAENNLNPILPEASNQIRALQTQSSDIQSTVGQEITRLQQREEEVRATVERER